MIVFTNQFKRHSFKVGFLLLSLILIYYIWLRGGLDTFGIDTDFGRDLSELSKLWIGQKVIWLGPALSPGFHASPLYYYLFFPALLLGQGSAYSLLLANALFALVILGIFGLVGIRKMQGRGSILALLVIGFSPWFSGLALHPGNGYTYVLWLLLSLVCLWFEFPLMLPSLFLGISISFHPAAACAIPLLFYEWIRRKHELKQGILIMSGLALPWCPIILFELITKGYLLRQWLTHPSVGMKIAPNLINIHALAGNLGLPLVGFVLVFIFLIFVGKKRERFWLLLSGLSMLFFITVSQVPSHYLLGITCLLFFTGVVILSQRVWGQGMLFVISLLFLIRIFLAPPSLSTRSIGVIQAVVQTVIQSQAINMNDKIAVIAALDLENKVPQADDYRFFLRTRGYTVLDVQNYSEANKMILFVENPSFDWKNWSTWETEQIGKKRIISEQGKLGIKIIVFEKEYR